MASKFIDTLEERGFIKDATNLPTIKLLNDAGALKPYIGFDLTADSLHVGSLIQLMVLRWAFKLGVPAIVVLGKFTTLIGDPTGKTEARPVLSGEQIEHNRLGIINAFRRVVREAEFQDNDWYDDLSFADFLGVYARHFSVNRMMAMDSATSRLANQRHLSLTEFIYSTVQAMDFEMLNSIEGVNLQIGGSDQWGNILMGADLIRQKSDRAAFGITTPLMLNSAGEKMGKTANGAIWLSKEKTDLYEFWQFWRNVEDDRVEDFLKWFTEISIPDIKTLMAGPINDAKKRLATSVTGIVHGQNEATRASKRAVAEFETNNIVEMPGITVENHEVSIEILVAQLTGETRSASRRLVEQNAVKANGVVVGGEIDIPRTEEFVLSVGKKRNYRVVWSDVSI